MEVTQELRDILSSGNDNYMNHYHLNKEIYNKHKTKCCGEDAKCCLEFHHVKEKNFNISKSLKHITPLLLLDELKLTVYVCKNCHSKIHNHIITLN